MKDLHSNVDLIMISHTNIVRSFPQHQFFIEAFSDFYRIDSNTNGVSILFHVREGIPSNLLSTGPLSVEYFFVELNLRKRKWWEPGSSNQNNSTLLQPSIQGLRNCRMFDARFQTMIYMPFRTWIYFIFSYFTSNLNVS